MPRVGNELRTGTLQTAVVTAVFTADAYRAMAVAFQEVAVSLDRFARSAALFDRRLPRSSDDRKI